MPDTAQHPAGVYLAQWNGRRVRVAYEKNGLLTIGFGMLRVLDDGSGITVFMDVGFIEADIGHIVSSRQVLLFSGRNRIHSIVLLPEGQTIFPMTLPDALPAAPSSTMPYETGERKSTREFLFGLLRFGNVLLALMLFGESSIHSETTGMLLISLLAGVIVTSPTLIWLIPNLIRSWRSRRTLEPG